MQITLYTAPGCGPCLAMKRALERAELEFRQVDLSQDAEAMERVRAFGYRQAPVVVVEFEGEEVSALGWIPAGHAGAHRL